MTTRELDQIHEKLDKLDEKIDNILSKLGDSGERIAKLESLAGMVKLGVTLVLPLIVKIIYDITRAF